MRRGSARRVPPPPAAAAVLVCKQWRRLVSDPHFLRRFRGRHTKPPLLGFFSRDLDGCKVEFTPALDPPDRVPPARFSLRLGRRRQHRPRLPPRPRTRRRLGVSPPPDLGSSCRRPAPRCDSTGLRSHALQNQWRNRLRHRRRRPHARRLPLQPIPGDNALWPGPIPPGAPSHPFFFNDCRSTLVGSCIYWLIVGLRASILKFELGAQSLAVIEAPPNVYQVQALVHRKRQFLITPADGGVLGFLVFSMPGFSAQLWKRDDVAGWVLGNTIELSNLLSLTPSVDTAPPRIVGFSEGDNEILLQTYDGAFMVHLESLLFKKVSERMPCHLYHPFASFYPAGTC
ncbi:uncharacterized protein LOC112898261 [Panicum hallii]|uniref:uncharacterized protein LOC112898261 n=1 Tax=Panicum hallii TaxID=206008 RepID=UPI000DF4D310|nr:uncharacterized protein LOC112898261 [Panicum hallii]